jgi:hypothetical protein
MQFAQEDTLAHSTTNVWTEEKYEGKADLRTPAELARIVSEFASSDGWLDRVRLRTGQRWYERLHLGLDYDIWAISWMPGQSTGFHDHGESVGAFIVATGALEEHRPGEATLNLLPGDTRVFGVDYAHDVRNGSLAPAVSIHAYSPPLNEMNEYELDGDDLVPLGQASERAQNLDRHEPTPANGEPPVRPAGIEQLLAAARSRLHRLEPKDLQSSHGRRWGARGHPPRSPAPNRGKHSGCAHH